MKRSAPYSPDARAATPPGARQAAPATPERLEAAGLRYLDRFAASAASLRRVLRRRVLRSAAAHGTDTEAGNSAVDEIVRKFQRTGLIDDSRYSETRTARLHRRGASARAIAADLTAKGIGRDLIATALDQTRHAGGDLAAAAAWVRRRRLGAYRTSPSSEATRRRDLGSLARAGFSREVAETVLKADRAQVEAILRGDG